MAHRGSPPSRTPPCRFPAVGSSGVTPPSPPGLCDPRWQQRVLTEDFGKPCPRQLLSTCPPPQPFPPDATDSLIELPNSAVVRASSVVLVMAAELGVQGFLLLVHSIVPVLFAPFPDGLQTSTQPLGNGLHVHCEPPLSAAGAYVHKAQEIEGCRFLSLLLRVL